MFYCTKHQWRSDTHPCPACITYGAAATFTDNYQSIPTAKEQVKEDEDEYFIKVKVENVPKQENEAVELSQDEMWGEVGEVIGEQQADVLKSYTINELKSKFKLSKL